MEERTVIKRSRFVSGRKRAGSIKKQARKRGPFIVSEEKK